MIQENKDRIIPKEKWVFDADVVDCFSDMLSRSIPQYEIMRNLVFTLSKDALKSKQRFHLLDIGCSDGLGMVDFVKFFGARGQYTAVDCSVPMIEKAMKRFSSWIDANLMTITNMDLRNDFPNGMYNVCLSVLTLMFIPINYRQRIIKNIYDHLLPGGRVFIVEKVLGESADINDLLINEYHELKENNGYSKDDIDRKKLSLEGVQVPVTNSWNVELLRQAGFHEVDVFWRYLNFVGYIAIK